ALGIAQTRGPRLMVAAALEALAGLVAQVGVAQRGVQLRAMAAALRAQMGTPARPLDVALEAAALANARTTLGTAAFDAAGRAGEEPPLAAILSLIPDLDSVAGSPAPLTVAPVLQEPLAPAPAGPPPETGAPGPHLDWGDALTVPTFYGREWELNLLTGWLM